jgi:hypothetical protein
VSSRAAIIKSIHNTLIERRLTMNEHIFDEEEQRIQRALNEAKKKELAEKYGACFPLDQSEIPPEIESEWLNSIEEFERQSQNIKMIPLREFLGSPSFRPLGEIPPGQLASELQLVMERLSLHFVSLSWLDGVSDAELYRFITTELFDHEIEDIRIEGMQHCFIYEEFHPNDEYDAKLLAGEFLEDLFARREEDAMRNFVKDEAYDPSGKPATKSGIVSIIRSFYERFAVFTGHSFECTGCTVEGDYATVKYKTEWSGLVSGSMESIRHEGVTVMRMKRSPYGGFDVMQANIPGLIEENECGPS